MCAAVRALMPMRVPAFEIEYVCGHERGSARDSMHSDAPNTLVYALWSGVCACAYMRVCVHVCTSAHVCRHACVLLCLRVCVCVHASVCVRVSVFMCMRLHVFTCAHECVSARV